MIFMKNCGINIVEAEALSIRTATERKRFR